MTTTAAAPRTTAELAAYADAKHAASNPNRTYHIGRTIAGIIAQAERDAYATEDRRTIRLRYIDALYARRTQAGEQERAAGYAWTVARRAAGVRHDWTPGLTDGGELGRLQRNMKYAALSYQDACNALAVATSTTSCPVTHLIELAQTEGSLVDPSYLLATVPDEFGRVSPFAVLVSFADRSWTSRNMSLVQAVKFAEAEAARPEVRRVAVFFDSCG